MRPAIGDGLEDGQVLGQRDLGAARAERELELVPDELAVQPVEQADGDMLGGDRADPAVQFPVELGVPERVAVGDRALEVLPELAQLRGLGVGDALGRLDCAERLERHPALGDRHRLFRGDDANPRAAVGDPLDEPLGGEIEQRRAERLPGDPERAREVLLDKPSAGGEIPAEDRLPDRGEGVRPRGLPGLRATGRSCWHAPNATEVTTDCQQSAVVIVDNLWGINQVSAPRPPWQHGRHGMADDRRRDRVPRGGGAVAAPGARAEHRYPQRNRDSIYQRIGYRPVEDRVVLAFSAD